MNEFQDPTDVFDEPEEESLDYNDRVRLPVGIEVNGRRYRDVTIEEMSGIDDELVSGKKANGNGAIGLTLVLCRCIQEIDGVVDQKDNPESLIDKRIVRGMTQIDRDFLITRIQMLGGNNTGILANLCPRCKKRHELEVELSELQTVEWPDESPLEVDFTLEVGHIERDNETRKPVKAHKEGRLRFPIGSHQEAVGTMQDPSKIMTSMLAACITQLGTLKPPSYEVVRRLKSRDRKLLMHIMKTKLPGLRQWKEVECDCGRVFDLTLDVSAFFDVRRK